MDEGYIKYNCHFTKSHPLHHAEIPDLIRWRQKLFSLGLIGAYPDGTGYGNMSMRSGHTFIITGTATGDNERINRHHFSLITSYSIKNNELHCKGSNKASSESLTHAAVYESDPHIHFVIHIHNKHMWDKLIHKVPTTSVDASYGTPELALEVKRVYQKGVPIIVLGGHEEGILFFGKTLDEAGQHVLKYFEEG